MKAMRVIFGATMMLAGFLLFLVQPMLAKFILPWFGGSATTWTVCMLFFQLALLAGYAYAHAITAPLSPRAQAVLQLAVLCAAALALPVTPSDALKPPPSGDPRQQILLLLAVCAGAPYAVLAATSPLLQRWLHFLQPEAKPSRYFALSNLGSFAGLLAYPFVFEPLLPGAAQTRAWSAGFALYGLMFGVCAMAVLRAPKQMMAPAAPAPEVAARGGRAAGWIIWSALGSALLLAVTCRITQWSAVVPFLWVLPLGLYLLTLAVAFGNPRLYARRWTFALFCALAAAALVPAQPALPGALQAQIGLQCAVLFLGCLICHCEMAALQPPPLKLPAFYLATAAGGALGGLLVTLAAPAAFSDYWEHPLVLTVIAALGALAVARAGGGRARLTALAGLAVFAAGLALLISDLADNSGAVVARARNFYGVVEVLKAARDDPREASLVLRQAGIDQGLQYTSPARRMEPACAYSFAGGAGRAMAGRRARTGGGPLRIGIIGLGAGMMAAHGAAGDTLRFYEINPAVTEMARRHFTFLAQSRAAVEIVPGDGRLALEREASAGEKNDFDVLLIDAFRGAAPPMHLMTREAFAIYLEHLAPAGVLGVNFDLGTFEMAPLHRGLAAEFGLGVRWVETPPGDTCENPAGWALYSRDAAFWSDPAVAAALSPWRDNKAVTLLWSDADSSLLSILRWRGLY